MTQGFLAAETAPHRLQFVDQRYAPLSCFALLTVACALASFAFTCATPFAAFAVIAAATLPLRPALLVVTGAWLINQTIGFSALHYPIDANSITWGFVIGAAALFATVISAIVLRLMPAARTPIALGLAAVCAHGAYELALYAATPFLGDGGAFTMSIVSRLSLLNLLWLVGLVAVCEIVRIMAQVSRRHTLS